MSKRVKYTAQLFDDLFIDAMGGDSVALDQYRDCARRLAKQVNQQLLETERRDIDSEAARVARGFLGEDRRRFRENVSGMDIEDLQNQVDALLAVRNTRDYSIPYAVQSQEQIEKLSEAMERAGVDISDAHVAYQINEMFKTGAWKEYRKAHGRSTNLIQAAQEEFKKGKTVDDLMDAYRQYVDRDETDRIDLVQSWELFAGTW